MHRRLLSVRRWRSGAVTLLRDRSAYVLHWRETAMLQAAPRIALHWAFSKQAKTPWEVKRELWIKADEETELRRSFVELFIRHENVEEDICIDCGDHRPRTSSMNLSTEE